MKKSEKVVLVAALFFLLHSNFALRTSFANEISVDKRTLQLDDTLTITVTLDDAFASVDSVRLPLRNLVIDGPPSISSEFQWINGQSSRRKIFQYSAHPKNAGTAVVGPVTLHGSGGQVETLAPISIQVVPDLAAGTNDPSKILSDLIAQGRDPIFLVAQVDKPAVFTGEETVVTWILYNATTIQQYAIAEIPKLDDFWSEELDIRGEAPEQVMLDGMVVQKMPIRRVALFPLRAGTLMVPPMGVDASIVKRVSTGDPFGLFEGMEVEVHRRSVPLPIRAEPIPAGPPVAAVGDIGLTCGRPVQRNGGPVVLDLTLSGRANLRAATPPAFVRPPDGTMQVADGALTVGRSRQDATMSRSWQVLLFPSHDGAFTVPAMSTTVLTPAGARRDLRCEASTLMVRAAAPSEPPPKLSSVRPRIGRRALAGWVGAAAALLLVLLFGWSAMRHRRRVRGVVRTLIRPTPAETRQAVDNYLLARGIDLAVLLHEASDRGDSYRALRSLLDALEHERVDAGDEEIAERVRDVVAI